MHQKAKPLVFNNPTANNVLKNEGRPRPGSDGRKAARLGAVAAGALAGEGQALLPKAGTAAEEHYNS